MTHFSGLFWAMMTACRPMTVCAISDSGGSSAPCSEQTSEEAEPRAAWIDVQTGYCNLSRSSDGGANLTSTEVVNVADPSQSVRLYSDVGGLMEISCDTSTVPRYDSPAVVVDPDACPIVYCNPHGGTNKDFGEAEDCGEDLWVYVYPSLGAYDAPERCGPWELN